MPRKPKTPPAQGPIPAKPDNVKWKKRSEEKWQQHVLRRREEYARNYPRLYDEAEKELLKRINIQPTEAPPEALPAPRPGLSGATYIPFGPFAVRVNPHLGDSGVRHYFYELGFDPEDAEPFIEKYLIIQRELPSQPIAKYVSPRRRNLPLLKLLRSLIRKHPKSTAKQLWNEIPKDQVDGTRIGDFKFYRRGERLCTIGKVDGCKDFRPVGESLNLNSFRKRVTQARKAIAR